MWDRKQIRIRQGEIDRLPTMADEDVEDTCARYVRAALLLAGIDPHCPLEISLDRETGDLLCREERPRFSRRTRNGPRPR
jgi:hypothetical protein